MMNSGGGNTPKADEKSLESGGYQQLKQSHNHLQHQFFSKSITTITLLFIAAALSCLILYHSAYHFQYFLLNSYKPLSSSIGSTNENQSSALVKEANISSSSHDDFKQGSLSSPIGSIPGNPSYSPSSDNTKPVNISPPAESVKGNLSSPITEEKEENKLERVLNKAAMENKTVILTTMNAAWTAPNSIFDLFLESFRIGNGTKALLNHLVVVALDQIAYSRCIELHPHCYALTTKGVNFSGEAHFMSKDYLKMMWRRIDFLGTVLEMGYNFIFTDADVMWFRNPFLHFYSDTDFQIACDHYWYASTDLNNSPNGGFNYVQSNNRSIQFYKFWYTSKNSYPGKHDQDVLNFIKYHPFIKKIGLSIQFLDTAYFGGFCEPSKNLNLVCTMHANCCIGLDNKIHDLKMLIDDWKNYMAMTTEEKSSNPTPTWTVPRRCG